MNNYRELVINAIEELNNERKFGVNYTQMLEKAQLHHDLTKAITETRIIEDLKLDRFKTEKAKDRVLIPNLHADHEYLTALENLYQAKAQYNMHLATVESLTSTVNLYSVLIQIDSLSHNYVTIV